MSTRRLPDPGITQQERAELGTNAELLTLYRRLSDEQPSADLDARILAMAQAAIVAQPQPQVQPARRRMSAWMSIAASTAVVILGAGLAWRMQLGSPRPAQQAIESARQEAARGDASGGAMPPAASTPVPEAPKPIVGADRAGTETGTLGDRPAAEGRTSGTANAEPTGPTDAKVVVGAPEEPALAREAPAAPAIRVAAEPAVADRNVTTEDFGAVAEEARAPATAERRAAPQPFPSAQPPVVVAAPPAPPAPAPAARPAPAAAITTGSATAGRAAESVPEGARSDDQLAMAPAPPPPPAVPAPAQDTERARDHTVGGASGLASKQAPGETMATPARSPLDPQAWLDSILALLASGHREEARISLAEWRRRYPHAEVPGLLRPLLERTDPAWQAEPDAAPP